MVTPTLLIFVNDRNLFSGENPYIVDSSYPLLEEPVYILWFRTKKSSSSQSLGIQTPNYPKRSLFSSKMKISRLYDGSYLKFKKEQSLSSLINSLTQDLVNSSSTLETVLKQNLSRHLDISSVKKLSTSEQIATYNLIASDYHDRGVMIWKYPVVPNTREIENHVVVFEAEKRECLGYGRGSLALTVNSVILNSSRFLDHEEGEEFLIKVYRCPAEIKYPLFQNKNQVTKQFEEFLKLFPLEIEGVPVDSIIETAQSWLEKNAL